MDRYEAGRALGLADADVLGVEETEDGTKVRVRDGGDRLITADGVFALTDHPATAHLRRHVVNESDGSVEVEQDDEQDGHGPEVPDGTAEAVLTWVGDDRERAAEALAIEEVRDHPRSVLVSKLRKVVAA